MTRKRLFNATITALSICMAFWATSAMSQSSEEVTTQDADGVVVITVGEQPVAPDRSQATSPSVESPRGVGEELPAADAQSLDRNIGDEPSPLEKTPPSDSLSQSGALSSAGTGFALLESDPPVQIDTTYQYDEIGRLISITKQVQ